MVIEIALCSGYNHFFYYDRLILMNFFNQQNGWKAGLQVYEALAFTVAAYSYITNPSATFSELGADMLLHCANFYGLSHQASDKLSLVLAGVNIARTGAIYAGVTAGRSAVSGVLNAVDVLGHLVSGLTILEDEDPPATADSIKMQ